MPDGQGMLGPRCSTGYYLQHSCTSIRRVQSSRTCACRAKHVFALQKRRYCCLLHVRQVRVSHRLHSPRNVR